MISTATSAPTGPTSGRAMSPDQREGGDDGRLRQRVKEQIGPEQPVGRLHHPPRQRRQLVVAELPFAAVEQASIRSSGRLRKNTAGSAVQTTACSARNARKAPAGCCWMASVILVMTAGIDGGSARPEIKSRPPGFAQIAAWPQPASSGRRARYLAPRPSLMDIERDRANHCCRGGEASMLRLGAIFVVLCMVLIAACTGAALYLLAGLNAFESMIVAVAVLTGLAIYNAVTSRLRDRSDVGSQIADLSRGTGDLARQVAELGRRTAALEGQGDKIVDSAAEKTRDRHRGDHRRARRARHPGEAARRDRRAARAQVRRRQGLRRRRRAAERSPGSAGRGGASRRSRAADSRDEMIDDGPRRHRCRPRRSLSAADRHPAAAQGPLLRGVHPAAHRRRRRAAAVRVSRRGRGRRADAADRQAAAVPQRAGGAPAAAQEPRDRPVLQHRRLDAERSAAVSGNPAIHGRQPRARAVADAGIAAEHAARHGAAGDRKPRGAARARLPVLHGRRDRPAHGAARPRRARHPLRQGAGDVPARRGRARPAPTSMPPTCPTCSAATASA